MTTRQPGAITLQANLAAAMRPFTTPGATSPDSSDDAYSLGRILAISDGVFAFALTLLVVDLIPLAGGNQSVATRLLELAPSYISYGLSFAVIAVSWVGHYDTFRYVRRVDGWLIMLNFSSLLLIAVLPFPTAVLGHNETDPAAAVLYASTIALTGVASAAIWLYATWHRRLVERDLAHAIVRRRLLLSVASPVVFFLSIPVALWRPQVAEVGWGVVWVLFFIVVRRYIDRRGKP